IVIFIWRYMATRQDRYLFLTAGFIAGAFCTKETAFMTVAAFIFFMDFLFARHIADKVRAKSGGMSELQYAGLIVVMLPVAFIAAFAWPFIAERREQYDLDEMPPEANLVVLMSTPPPPQYSAAIQLPPGFGDPWRN